MKAKPRVSPENTYILDDDDVEELDGLSITAVLDEASDSRDSGDTARGVKTPAPDEDMTGETAHLMDREPTIDELLEDSIGPGEDTAVEMALEDTGRFEALDVLLAPEVIFGSFDDD